MKKYRAAVIGCGKIGFSWELDKKQLKPATHFGAFRAHPRIELVGVCDPAADFDSIKKLAPEVPVFKEAENLIKGIKPDIVSVAVPGGSHREMVELAVKNDAKLIICEKPISESWEDAQAIVDVCRKNEVMLLVNHLRRFNPDIAALRKEIISGVFGEMRQVQCLYTNGLLNNGSHIVDLLTWFLGKVDLVWGRKNGNALASYPGDFCVDGMFIMKSGAKVGLQSLNRDDYNVFEIAFYGTEGAAMIKRNGFVVEGTAEKKRTPIFPHGDELDWENSKKFNLRGNLMWNLVDHAVDCLDGKTQPLATGEEAIYGLKVLLALRESAERGIARFV